VKKRGTTENKKEQKKRGPPKGSRPPRGAWKKGQSGNPGGRPREIGYLRELARERTEEAIETLADVMLNGESDSARVAAATALLDRGYGRPSQTVEVEGNIRDSRSVQIAQAIADAHPELAEVVFGAAVAGRLVAKKNGPEGEGAGQAGADGA
jgi:hypothetical protein